MLIKEIEDLKEKLNDMISSEDFTYKEILKVSQCLDVLIVKYLKETY
jgi:hypothetical protein